MQATSQARLPRGPGLPGALAGGLSPARTAARAGLPAAPPRARRPRLPPAPAAPPGDRAAARPASPAARRAATPPGARVPPRSDTAPGSGARVDARDHLPQHLGMVAFSSWALAATTSVAGAHTFGLDAPLWAPALAGACLGGAFAALHRHASVRLWRPPSAPLRLVVTGGTRGLGKALAREALLAGDSVVITGRSAAAAAAAAAELRAEAGELLRRRSEAAAAAGRRGRGGGSRGAGGGGGGGGGGGEAAPRVEVHGVACDVSDPAQVAALGEASAALLGSVDAWVVNAGQSGAFRPFLEAPDGAIEQVVRTNLLGGLLCAREAARRLSAQPAGGHIFFMDGAGSDGSATPYYAAYGATKAALPQLAKTLRKELSARAPARGPASAPRAPASAASGAAYDGLAPASASAPAAASAPASSAAAAARPSAASGAAGGPAPAARARASDAPPGPRHPVGVHVLSPGMMLTDLLLENASEANLAVFNILCEHPETVAAYLVPRLRTAVARGQDGTYHKFLTPASAAWRFATAPARAGRFFDAAGRAVYPPEGERILGAGARATARARAAAAARGGALRAAYSLSVAAGAAAVVLFDTAARAAGQ
ncbi:chlorophyll(ide) b reductase chloroplastic-like [Raphidocelis subcapitata]|uniref:Chlorophyll(Ide) b reductase chloroplastic-like n=1 Tax=Raphidocelis subcapitata TaxID=307507 RepID=A0A2V0P5N4_9CHLO|nr:chlorophyll(ide) b reductase chloroplastic-like [Raphidocelis subcapitata]|eukprot:GBF94242.1 chlorophyll(ide) b reductase chloroplastic-like [Raphidocelis subcapitata]